MPAAGYALRQKRLDSVKGPACLHAPREALPGVAVLAWAADEVADFKIKAVPVGVFVSNTAWVVINVWHGNGPGNSVVRNSKKLTDA